MLEFDIKQKFMQYRRRLLDLIKRQGLRTLISLILPLLHFKRAI